MFGRGAAAAADDVHEPFGGKLVQQATRHIGRFVITGVAHGVGQTGIGVAADERITRDFVQLLDVGAHERGTQRAIQANGQGLGVAHAVPKSRHRLPEPPRIKPARGPPLWDGCDAQGGEGMEPVPNWDEAAQPAPGFEVDQRVSR